MPFPQTISSALLSSARWNANQAIEYWDSEEHDEVLHSSACVGIAAELLLKHLLALESPALLADLTPKDKEKALNARKAFASDTYDINLSSIHSCSADDAFFIHLKSDDMPDLVDKKDFLLVMKVRNAACHLAALSPIEDRRDAIHILLEMFDKSKIDITDGSHNITSIQINAKIRQFESSYKQDRFKLIMEKVDAIKTRRPRTAPSTGVDQYEIEANNFLYKEADQFFGEFDEWDKPAEPVYRSHKCMICEQKAILICEIEGALFDVPNAPSGAEEYYEYGNILYPFAFACAHCGLNLTLRELRVLADKERNNQWAQKVIESIEEPSGECTNGKDRED